MTIWVQRGNQMKSIDKQKMCPSCEGRIPVDAEICPYCATELLATNRPSPLFQSQSLEDSLSALYKPPYSAKRTEMSGEAKLENSLYKEPAKEAAATPKEAGQSSLLPTLLLLTGSNLFLIGLMQLFFAKDGLLQLEWDGSYWFLYCLFALPILYFGYRKVQDLDL